ncbi:hypothetical protein [Peribacillus huizhouensis]|uniref:Bacitracin ABC transporter ATP-binding protein n=1 Tax=Peribacillus huizhouensis TaxID=1501239 RepID=A0ABR6CMG7_9BACI|nr:hypothetical protein [Peribacillus huizhouensis]MBA9026124.1 hypothetical protein [Peribacillus huizhouensis]
MFKENNPLLSDEFLNEVVRKINREFGFPIKEKDEDLIMNDLSNKIEE